MGRLIRLRWPRPATSRSFVIRGAAGCGALVLLAAAIGTRMLQPPGATTATGPEASRALAAAEAAAAAQARAPASQSQIIIPDLLVVAPAGLTAPSLARLGKIAGVRSLISFDGAQIKAGAAPVTVIGVNPATFRPWVPLETATDQAFWTALTAGDFVTSPAARTSLSLRPGSSYQLTGTSRVRAPFGGSASLGISEVDMLVNTKVSRQLGLVRSVAALVSAPGVATATLTAQAKTALGPAARVVSLRQQQLPAAAPSPNAAQPGTTQPGTTQPGTIPATYLELFQASAAQYCPGLSWTVLAAIGQIESGDGANDGPSSAGALGPMQFLPSTWATWGIDAFGQTGPPNIMNPYDAVPSAARLLCANGATAGGANSLANAIFDYNHATWYVNEVLSLAAQYARDY